MSARGWSAHVFYPHSVVVKNLVKVGGMGRIYDDPRTLPAEVIDQQRLVRTATGQEAVSSTQVTVSNDTHVPLGSLVTVWKGTPREREATVLFVAVDENPPPLDSFLVLSLE